MARLKSFADAHGLCLLLVHHTRKQNADDKFDMISGTSGLLGAADGAFLLQKEKRTGNAAKFAAHAQAFIKLYGPINAGNGIYRANPGTRRVFAVVAHLRRGFFFIEHYSKPRH